MFPFEFFFLAGKKIWNKLSPVVTNPTPSVAAAAAAYIRLSVKKKEFSNKTKMSEHVLEMAPRFLVASTFSRKSLCK